jgi:hypothetical protein
MFGAQRVAVTGDWKRLQNEKLYLATRGFVIR